MSSQGIAGNHYVYHAHERDTLLGEVVASVCVLLPRSFVVAGFSADGTVLVIKHITAAASQAEWDAAFFEYDFLNEPLLAIPSQLKAVFIAGEHTLAIPDELYDADALSMWMNSIHHLAADNQLDTYSATADKMHYAFTLPAPVHDIIARYFTEAKILPVAAYQFHKAKNRKDAHMQCLVADQLIVATLRINGKLTWHQVFDYTTAEDIAWQFTHLCKTHHIHAIDLNVEVTTLSERDYDLIPELETFFPKITWSAHQMQQVGHWAPSIFLMQQLHACVS